MAPHQDLGVVRRLAAAGTAFCGARDEEHICYLGPAHTAGRQRDHECEDGHRWPAAAEDASAGS